jgi:hypothetical protein
MKDDRENLKTMVTLKMMSSRDGTCAFCGHPFTLGETVVRACGGWSGGTRLVHERDAVWDPVSGMYVERRCFDRVMVCRSGKA